MTPGQVMRGQLAACGPFIYDGHEVDARTAGVFEVVGDEIAAWRHYYDAP